LRGLPLFLTAGYFKVFIPAVHIYNPSQKQVTAFQEHSNESQNFDSHRRTLLYSVHVRNRIAAIKDSIKQRERKPG
jgi:hypothetical protein